MIVSGHEYLIGLEQEKALAAQAATDNNKKIRQLTVSLGQISEFQLAQFNQ